MKKITLLFMFAILGAFSFSSYAQTLNQNASWPNAAWSVTGTYNTDPLAFESDPLTTTNFAFDDDDAGSASDDDIAAESPVIDLTAAHAAGETWLSISGNFVYNYNTDDILQFEYWDADAASWNIIGLPINADTTTAPLNDFCSGTSEAYTSEILNIVGFSATQLSGFRYRIYFNDTVNGAGWVWGFCFESPTITSQTPPACPDPSGLSASGIQDTTADLAWVENGSATAWDVEIVTSGSAATGTPTATGVTNPYTAMTLTADTLYDYYVSANCGVDGTSAWVGPFTFRTACSAIATPYVEDFETFTTAGTAFTTENCWAGTGGSYFWESAPGTDAGSGGTGPDPTITTGNYFYTEASGGASGDITDLVSPLVDLSGLTAPSLGFNYHMFGNQMGALDVLVNGTTNVFTISGEQQTSATADWELAVIDLTAYAGQSISVTFRATSAGTYEGDMAIDNVRFDELPACIMPNGLTATNIDGFSADLSWIQGGAAASWNIELVDITAGGTVSGIETNPGVTNPFNITGLVPANDYEYYVQADCGVDGTSAWAGPFSFSTTIACPEPSGLTATNIMTTSADLSWTAGASETVWDIEIVDITAGGAVTGTATASGVANPYNATSLAVGNDYEFYVIADCAVNGTSIWVGPFAFTTLETCPAPSGLGATGITLTTAELEWTENGGATSWNIELVNNTAGDTVTGTATETGVMSPYSATGLVGDNSYSFYVQADCGAGDMSTWTGPFTFATPYVAVPASCSSEIFLDSGGVTGDYANSENVTYTIMPDTPGDIVSVVFNAFSAENNGTGCYDGLTIYDGPDATATTIDPPAGGTIWCWDRDDVTPSGSGDLQGMTITSSHASGALTFVFSSDGSATREGWEASVVCTTLSVDDFDNGLAFTYFPNPVNNSLVLKAQKDIENISVYNMLGQEVLRTAPNTVHTEVNMSDLQSGAYFVKVTIDNATETVRVIKN